MAKVLDQLREMDLRERVGTVNAPGIASLGEFEGNGVAFAAGHSKLEALYYRAVHDLMNCVVENEDKSRMLIEGAEFIGCWLESTGTINTEIFSRFCPETAKNTFLLFAEHRRSDGLIPYKVTAAGPAYRQVQMVTPLARSVWTLYCRNHDKDFLRTMYQGIKDNDAWLVRNRNTRGTGCVEAFGTFDTGHDASPRFWHVPDVPFMDDPSRYDPDSPILPFLAPDMTANVYCQRKYMAKMAEALGLEREEITFWTQKSAQSLESLMTHCYDPTDEFFYDRDRSDRFVRVQTDNFIRVFACEAGSDEMFRRGLERYLLNTRKFFTRYPITTIAIDDPRYHQAYTHNSWAGQVSFLTQARLTRAFEYHRRYVELTWIMHPILTALSRFTKFTGSLCGWLGHQGYGENYTPTMLCLLDYVERMCGICEIDEGSLWFTSLVLQGMDYGDPVAPETAYRRKIDGITYELENNAEESKLYTDGKLRYIFPHGVRLVTYRDGRIQGLIGMVPRKVIGTVIAGTHRMPFEIEGNELQRLEGERFVSTEKNGVVLPRYGDC